MKKTLLVITSLLAITACGTKTVYVTPETVTTPAPSTPPPTTQAPEPEFLPGSTSDFVYAVESLVGPIYVPESDLIETGLSTCEFLRNGGSAYEIMDMVYENPDPEFVSAVISAAVIVLCPDQKPKFDRAFASAGI